MVVIVGPVQLLQGHQQMPNPALTRIPWLGTRQPVRQDGVRSRSLHPLVKLLEALQRLLQPLADAGTQLFGPAASVKVTTNNAFREGGRTP